MSHIKFDYSSLDNLLPHEVEYMQSENSSRRIDPAKEQVLVATSLDGWTF